MSEGEQWRRGKDVVVSERTMAPATGRVATIGVAIALLAPVLPPLVSWLAGWNEFSTTRLLWSIPVHWLTFAVIVTWVLRVEKLSLRSIGVLPLRWWTLPLGMVLGVAILLLCGILIGALHLSADTHFGAFLLSQPWPLKLVIVITAGVFEEAAYRGYALERLSWLLGNKWLASVITVLCFAFAHIPAVGLSHVLPVLIISVFVTLLYLWRRDLILNMVAHAMVDATSLLILPALLAGRHL